MKAAKALFLLLQISLYFPAACTSSSFSRRRSSFSPRSRLEKKKYAHDITLTLRGGQQPSSNGGGAGGVDAASSTPSYHGNYVAQAGEQPPAAATTTVVQAPPVPAPPVLASATSTSSKMSNLQERTGPALLMLAATFLLLKFTGNNGLIGLVFVMQIAMYSESTSVVEDFGKKGGGAGEDAIASFPLQKWWWFATAMMLTSGRCVIKHNMILVFNPVLVMLRIMSPSADKCSRIGHQ